MVHTGRTVQKGEVLELEWRFLSPLRNLEPTPGALSQKLHASWAKSWLTSLAWLSQLLPSRRWAPLNGSKEGDPCALQMAMWTMWTISTMTVFSMRGAVQRPALSSNCLHFLRTSMTSAETISRSCMMMRSCALQQTSNRAGLAGNIRQTTAGRKAACRMALRCVDRWG